jgi:proteasome lid subunit RPN8/RPN11
MLVNLPEQVLSRLREFFRDNLKNDKRERACLVSKSGDIIPVENVSPDPFFTVLQNVESFATMADMVKKGELLCWAHSHPRWPALPSIMDITNHHLPVDMLIYSCVDDDFSQYSPEEITHMDHNIIAEELLIK